MFCLLNKALQKQNQISLYILHQVAVLVEDRTTQKFEHNQVERVNVSLSKDTYLLY